MLMISVLERQSQDELWGSLASHSCLLGELQASESLHVTKQHGQWLRKNTLLFSGLSMHAHTCAPSQNEHTYYTGSMYVLRYTHMPYALHMLCVTFFIVVRVMCSCMVMVPLKMLIHFWNRTNGLMNIKQHDPRGWSLSSPSWRGIRAKVPQLCPLLACVQCLDTCQFSYDSPLHLEGAVGDF